MIEPLYRQLLGGAYSSLPAAIQEMHDVRDRLTAEGSARVERGQGLGVRLIGWLLGFPPAAPKVPLTVTFRREPHREVWDRSFCGKRLRSTQETGTGRQQGLLVERFGPLAFSMTVSADALPAVSADRSLHLRLRSGWFFGIPLPQFLLPRMVAFEHGAGDCFNFHVDLALPVLGRLVRYTGWLRPVPSVFRQSQGKAL